MEVATKPGTANVTPADRAKLAPLLKHYGKMAHPFTACYRDQIKHGLSSDHAKRRCAVLKALIREKNLSELREYVDRLDASGADCDQLQQARRVLDMASKKISEDDPRFNWRTMGNGKRGVILKGGKRAVVTAAQFDRLKAGGKLDPKTPRLKGDSPADAKAPSAPTTAKTAPPLVKRRITRGPRKGQVVEGRMINGRFWEVRTNREKGNPRAGREFVEGKNAKGQKVHKYVIGGKVKDIVVK